MISLECIRKYNEQYPDDDCCYEESFGDVVIERGSDGKAFYNPAHEADEVFFDRLNRSKEIGHNLFYEEWEEFEYEPEDDY